MAELTKLESKPGEVAGLAMAAQAATTKVIGLAEGGPRLAGLLDQHVAVWAGATTSTWRAGGRRDHKAARILRMSWCWARVSRIRSAQSRFPEPPATAPAWESSRPRGPHNGVG
jgi:hypothetical protein